MNYVWIEIVFWTSAFIVFYIYFGYLMFLSAVVLIKRIFVPARNYELPEDLPEVSLFIAAYNEKDFIDEKIKNSLQIDYPKDKLHFLWVTDGSDDGTPEKVRQYPEMTVLHENERKGKIAAINRGMQYVKTPIVVFCDANTYLSPESVKEIVKRYTDPKVGCVAGEKSIFMSEKDAASSAGEGMYWKIESKVKTYESELGSVCGAAGELFSIRTELFQPIEPDTLLDDFIISMRIAEAGYKIKYAPRARAQEYASANVEEEKKRKIRIASGGIQSIFRLLRLLNIFKYPWLSFTFLSHKAFRWTLLPLMFFLALIANAALVFLQNGNSVYVLFLVLQAVFYMAAAFGWYFEQKQLRLKLFFAPYYMLMINWSILLGMRRYYKGSQSVNWERAKRKQ